MEIATHQDDKKIYVFVEGISWEAITSYFKDKLFNIYVEHSEGIQILRWTFFKKDGKLKNALSGYFYEGTA